MTADEIVAASGSKARRLTGSEQSEQSGANFTTLAVARFETGPFEFEVSFRARKGETTLHTVRLELQDPQQYLELSNSLSARYGEGEVIYDEEKPIGSYGVSKITKTRWHSESDTIVLQILRMKVAGKEIANTVSIDYSKKLDDVDL